MKKAYTKDILRSLKRNAKKLSAIMVITALGVGVFTGISASCDDMYLSADRFFDEQNLYDVQVQSTYGLTDDDVTALTKVDGIKQAAGIYNEVVTTKVDDESKTASVTTISDGINKPYLKEGSIPNKSGEIAVTAKYINASKKKVGDSITISDNTDALKKTSYKISGVVLDPTDLDNGDSPTAFRSTSTGDFSFFITDQDVDSDVYTSVYLTLKGAKTLAAYSDEYETLASDAVSRIEKTIKKQREQARYDSILADAKDEISEQEDEANATLDDAEQKLADARTELEDGKEKLAEAKQELTDKETEANEEIASARAEIEDGRSQLEEKSAELASGEQAINDGQAQIDSGRAELAQKKTDTENTLDTTENGLLEKQKTITATKQSLDSAKAGFVGILTDALFPNDAYDALRNASAAQAAEQLSENPEADIDTATIAVKTTSEQQALTAALTDAVTTIGSPDIDAETLIPSVIQTAIGAGVADAASAAIESGLTSFYAAKSDALAQLDTAETTLNNSQAELDAKRQELEDGKAQIQSARDELDAGEVTLNEKEAEAKKQIEDAKAEIADKEKELTDGETELSKNETEFNDKKADAKDEIADAYDKLDDIDMTQWYVFDRTSISSYSGLDSDVNSINNIGKLFPLIFVLVAVLISLTTMTRMVEADRGLIGTYKGLGYTNGSISKKYMMFGLLSSVLGSGLGFLIGFVLLPKFLLWILGQMYALPNLYMYFHTRTAILGCVIFIGGILGSTLLALRKELAETPASLMRPKAPRAGSRILLERITFIWKRLKFLNKVTSRNLFRYKKRLIMTLVGIMGCTALVVSGFCIKDSVTYLRDGQYEDIIKYDAMAVADADDNGKLVSLFDKPDVKESLNIQVQNVKLFNADGKSESVTLMVLPDGADISSYIETKDMDGKKLALPADGTLLTKNASMLLGLDKGSSATLQLLNLDEGKVTIGGVVQNYLGNTMYMHASTYKKVFSSEFTQNAVLANFSDSVKDKDAYAAKLLNQNYIMSSVNVAHTIANFSADFAMINAVVYVLILFAAVLAFAVLFTLCSTNISERIRELATLKVLGFYDKEVHSYVNKETLLLTLIGVLLGLPAGYVLGSFIIGTLKMPSIYFAVNIEPISYVISGIVAFSFAIIVNFMTYPSIDRVDMVEALKSVE